MDDTAELTNPGALTQILASGGNPDPSPSFASASENAPPVPAPDVSGNATDSMPATSSLGGQMPPPREPGTSELAKQPYHKAEFFRSMLGDFLFSVGKGLAARGGGPEADSRGAGVAISALPERNIMQQQMQIQRQQAESEAALRKAQANKAEQEAQSVPVTLGNGQQVYLPASIAKQILAAQSTGQSRVDVQNLRNTGAENIQGKKNEGALDVQDLRNTGAANVAQIKADNRPPTEMSLLMSAQKGDKDAAAALNKLQQDRLAIARQRGPAAQIGNYFDPDFPGGGRLVSMSKFQAGELQQQGHNLVPAGQVPADKILQVQRAQRAVPAAIAEVRKNLKAWDNTEDRAIFAKILKENPMGGDPQSWFSNVLDQAATAKLSTEGQNGVIALRRLNDALGSVRVISGLPSTVGSMMTTAALAPSAHTPDSKFAAKQLDSLSQLVEQETGVPLLGGSEGGSKGKKLAESRGGKSTAYSTDNPFK